MRILKCNLLFSVMDAFRKKCIFIVIIATLCYIISLYQREADISHSSLPEQSRHISLTENVWLKRRKEALANSPIKKVLLFCYMRGGSTYFSSFFRRNQEFLYFYEPFAAFYHAYHGMTPWSFPEYIFWDKVGEDNYVRRLASDREIEKLTDFNHGLFYPNATSLPKEFYTHVSFLNSSSLRDTAKCIRSQGGEDKFLETCFSLIKDICGKPQRRIDSFNKECFNKLTKADELLLDNNNDSMNSSFIAYKRCRNEYFNTVVKPCFDILKSEYEQKKVVIYKGLRLSMKYFRHFLERDPDLHIVQLIRDPRGTVASRLKIGYIHKDARQNKAIEAKLLCHKMLEDQFFYRELEKNYPGSVLQVKYEELLKRPKQTISLVYSFFNTSVPVRVMADLSKKGKLLRNNSTVMTSHTDKWKAAFTVEEQNQIQTYCKKAFSELGYSW